MLHPEGVQHAIRREPRHGCAEHGDATEETLDGAQSWRGLGVLLQQIEQNPMMMMMMMMMMIMMMVMMMILTMMMMMILIGFL